MKLNYLILLAGLVVAEPLRAQEQDAAEDDLQTIAIADEISDDYITVLASGARERLDWTGESVTVFGRDDFDQVQGADLTRLLERAPGVALSRNGGPGNFTAVRVRGAEGEQLLVLIDGVRVADVAAPGGGFDFGNLLMGNLAKVELQRSSNSTIWGSQALGGVLAATTGSRGEYVSGSAEYGAHDTFYGTLASWLPVGPADLDLAASHFTSDGFSAAAGGSEPDGFRQTELAGKLDIELGDSLRAFAHGRYADGRLEIDGFPAPDFALADTAEYQDTRQGSGAMGLAYEDGSVELRATYSLADTERDNFDPALGPAPSYSTDGTSERAELRGRWWVAADLALDFGGEREWQRFSTLFDPVRGTAISGGYAQLDYDSGPLHLAAGIRRDEHRDFGSEWSLGADAVYDLTDGLHLTASYGEGFKAPTLFQLHSDFGNVALQPERSRSYDFGFRASPGPALIEVTAFLRDTENLVGFVGCFGVTGGICAGRPFGTYDNIGKARAQGIEAQGHVYIAHRLQLGAAYALLDADDRTPSNATRGNDLARRPEHALTMTADWEPVEGLSFGSDLRVVSDSYDDAANLVPLDGYAVLTLRGEWDATEAVTLFARVENVWDESYETAAGYATPGRGAYVGARARW